MSRFNGIRSMFLVLIAAFAATTCTTAFVPPLSRITRSIPTPTYAPSVASSLSSSCLSERKWNFNEGQAPWGVKKNAEIWNGRVAQVAFAWVFLQELITGKGIFKGLDEGDAFFVANAVGFAVCVIGLTGWLALQGTTDYTKDD